MHYLKEKIMKINEYLNRRNIFFLFFFAVAFFIVFEPLKALYYFSGHKQYYSHIVLIPLVSIYLIYQKRKIIFSDQQYSFKAGIPLLFIGALIYFLPQGIGSQLNQNDFTSIVALSAVIFLNGAFILFFGVNAYRVAMFPLLFLIFVIPIPSLVMDGIIYLLQVVSTEFTNVLLMASGIPYFRDGFIFHLPGQSVEVAKECSGIRSSIALFITTLLAGHLFLKTWWNKGILTVAIIPVTMLKNGIRIVSLTLLGTYVDSRILTNSSLHTDGGMLFFILALLLLAPVLFFLRRSEKKGDGDG